MVFQLPRTRSSRCLFRDVRLERLPNSAGISPLNSLLRRFRDVRLERLPNSAGISPLKA